MLVAHLSLVLHADSQPVSPLLPRIFALLLECLNLRKDQRQQRWLRFCHLDECPMKRIASSEIYPSVQNLCPAANAFASQVAVFLTKPAQTEMRTWVAPQLMVLHPSRSRLAMLMLMHVLWKLLWRVVNFSEIRHLRHARLQVHRLRSE